MMANSIGLYLHIPFCRRKCAYCDFFSGTGSEADYENYTNELNRAVRQWGQIVTEPVSSVYFGGGTPSVLGTGRLCALLNTVRRAFAVEDSAEITLEVNPESGMGLRFDRLRAAGFNRVSVGLQSAIPREIEALGRIHTPEDAARTVRLARESGIGNTSLDLMTGIPFQTRDSLRRSIDFCVACGVKHISSYMLKIEKGTRFDSIKEKLPLPDDDEQAELYHLMIACLKERGYEQYEISNFAVPSFESRHNTLYWRCGEYIGIGPSAHSFYRGRRFHYERSLPDFCRGITTDDGEGGGEEEYIMLALRLKAGLCYADHGRRFDKPLSPGARAEIEKYARFGFMEADGRHACFTPKGFLVSNRIIADVLSHV